MKIINTKKIKIILSFLGVAALITPIVAVSAVACSSENKETLNNSKIVISTEPSSQTVFINQNENLPTLSIVATTSDQNAKLIYQWYENDSPSTTNGKAISGATQSTYAIPEVDAKKAGIKYFYVVVSAEVDNNIVSSLISSVSILTIIDKIPEITVTSEPKNQTANVGQTENLPTFSVAATTNNSEQKLTYQWYSNTTDSNTNGTEIAGATSPSYTTTSANVSTATTTYFYVKVSGTINGVPLVPITSNVATLTVTAVPIITIKTQPTDQTIYANQTTSFPSFAVTVDNIEGAKLTYQWYSNTTNSATGAVAIEGATNASYSIKQSDIGNVGSKKYYYVVISGSINGASLAPVNSNIVSLTTQAVSTITITTQPTAEQIVAKDASVTLNVTANSTATTNVLTYQWQKANSDAADATWTNISGANAATYTFNENNDYSTITYYRVVINQEGTSATATSTTAKVTVGYTNAQAQAQMNEWLSNNDNQKNLLNSYFAKSSVNPLSILNTPTSTSLGLAVWTYNFSSLPTAKVNSITFVEATSANALPADAWQIQATTTTSGTYETWNSSSETFENPVAIPVGTIFTFYLPFSFKDNVTVTTTDPSVSAQITRTISLTNGSSNLSFATNAKIPWNKIQGSFNLNNGSSGTVVDFSFCNPSFYSFNNTNSDLPAFPILSSSVS